MNLPSEIYAEILKLVANQRQISKNINQYNKDLFYNAYCQQDISQHEIINYLTSHHGHTVYMFVEDGYNRPYLNLYEIIPGNTFLIHIFTISIDHINNGEFIEILNNKSFKTININKFIKTFTHLKVYYDVFTTVQIIGKRHCDLLNPTYINDYMANQLIQHIPNIMVNDVYSLYHLYKKLLYIDINKGILTNDEMEIDLEDIIETHYALTDVIFEDGVADEAELIEAQSINDYYNKHIPYLITLINRLY